MRIGRVVKSVCCCRTPHVTMAVGVPGLFVPEYKMMFPVREGWLNCMRQAVICFVGIATTLSTNHRGRCCGSGYCTRRKVSGGVWVVRLIWESHSPGSRRGCTGRLTRDYGERLSMPKFAVTACWVSGCWHDMESHKTTLPRTPWHFVSGMHKNLIKSIVASRLNTFTLRY